MNISTSRMLWAARRQPLAACCAALFALAAPEAFATTWPVTSCSDHDPGSLRDVVGNVSVVSGDTVDLSNLTCSGISLTTGAIAINQSSLAVQGPTSRNLTIFMPVAPPVPDTLLYHSGTGTLSVDNLRLSFGYGHPDPTGNGRYGGCIDSLGNVVLSHVTIGSCIAVSHGAGAGGGGIRTQGNLTMSHSYFYSNSAGYQSGLTSVSNLIAGGGALVVGNFFAKYSTINGNSATAPANNPGFATGSGGGIWVLGNTTITNSTISNNTASLMGGGIYASGSSNKTESITNSTISGNTAAQGAGMLIADAPTVIRGSTIAFNRNTTNPSAGPQSAGATFEAIFNSFTVDLQTSLVSNNGYRLSQNKYVPDDVGVLNYTNKSNTTYSVTISGANNLIYATDSTVGANGLPPDTIKGACPLLEPLRNNGGETKTHALTSSSPAIDKGNNTGSESYDQRGGATPPPIAQPPLGYPRVSGPAADIGAFEYQYSDTIFNSNFEGCP